MGNKEEKSQKIQLLRSIAIVCVVMIHTMPSGQYPNATGWYQVFVRPFLNICVASFIFISGFLTPITINSVFQFYRKRIIRVLIPYLIWTIAYSFIQHAGIDGTIKNILTAGAGPQFYYVYAYIELVLITPLLKSMVYSKYRNLGWIVSPFFIVIFKYIPLFFNTPINQIVFNIWDNSFLGWFSYYYLGIMLGNDIIGFNVKTKNMVLLLALFVVVQILEGYLFWTHFNQINCGTQIKLSVLFTNMAVLFFEYKYINSKYTASSKLLLNIGNYSPGIFFSHILIMQVTERLFPVYSCIPFCLNSILIIGISFICAFLGRKVCGKKLSKFVGLI